MDKSRFSEQILDYIEGTLPSEDALRFEEAMKSDPDLMTIFKEYEEICDLESEISKEEYELHPNFTVKVMQSLNGDKRNLLWRFIMEIIQGKKLAYQSIALIAVAIVGIKLYQLQDKPRPRISTAEPTTSVAADPERVKGPVALKEESDKIQLLKGDQSNLVKQREVTKEAKRAPEESLHVMPDAVMAPEESNEMEAVPMPLGSTRGRDHVLSKSHAIEQSTRTRRPEPQQPFAGSATSIFAPRVLPPTREQYNIYGENDRILVNTQATSTFSIDVDTGSYTNARRYLSQGKLPPKNSVRLEEFVNYFDYSYPLQSDKPFSLNYEIAPSPLEQDRYFLKLGVKARDVADNKKPWHLTFLVDVSGSMSSPDKLELVKRALKVLVGTMRPEDKVSIVTYAGHAGLLLESASVKEKQKILNAIEQLSSGGSTAGEAGIKLAYSVAERNRIPDGVNRVILATDGDFNVGLRSQDALIDMVENKRRSGTTLTTIGVGTGNIQEGMMEQLANKGNGNYFYLDSFKEARKVFETEIAGTIEVVAKDVKLQIEFNPEHVLEYRLVGYENRKLENRDFSNDKIDAGEIGSGHTVTAIYEIVLQGTQLAKELATESRYQQQAKSNAAKIKQGFSKELGFLKVRHKAPGADTSSLLEFPIKRADVLTDPKTASDDFRFASAVVYFAQMLRGSDYIGNYDFDAVTKLAQGALGDDAFGYRREFVELVKNAKAASM